jgi:predicted  nucleic acid-binding Zn-ribbon protein
MSTRRRSGVSALLACVFFTTLAPTTLPAQDDPAPAPETGAAEGQAEPAQRTEVSDPSPAAAPARPTDSEALEESLARILNARAQLDAELRSLQDELESDAGRGRREAIEEEIRATSREREELMRSFAELSSGIDPESFEVEPVSSEIDLASEIRELLNPLVNELKRATSRPREIDRLRTEISKLEERLGRVRNALGRVRSLASSADDPGVQSALEKEEGEWSRLETSLATDLQIAQRKLDQRLSENQSIAGAVENLFQIFFKSRGRNLLLALLASIAFLLANRRLRRFLSRRQIFAKRADSFEGRVVGLAYSIFSVLGAVLVFIVALYLFGDWVLLILVLLLIFGIIWTSKQAIPRFWSQMMLMLDMGPVRKGERVIWDGLRWKVESISFYSILTNPDLVGGLIRLPIDDLAELRSRPYRQDEHFFPTRQGDVVRLPDDRPAKVEFQSVDAVRLRVPGGNKLIVPSRDFTAQNVEKLSDGYRVAIRFGLDYGDQARITTTMRSHLQRRVEEHFRSGRWRDSVENVSIEFEEAGSSSLIYFVRVDFDGQTAFDYAIQKRELARVCVDVCNEQGWTIPFTQLTLHVADAGAQDERDAESDPTEPEAAPR